MLGEPMFSRVMVTIGLAVVIRSGVILVWGVEPKPYPRPLGEELIRFGEIALYPGQIFSMVVLAVLCAAVGLLPATRGSASRCAPPRTTKDPPRC